MTERDSTTEGMCWASHKDFSRDVWKSRQVALYSQSQSITESNNHPNTEKIWKPLQSPQRWICSHVLACGLWLLQPGAILLEEGVQGEEAVLVGDEISKSASSAIRKLLQNGFNSDNYLRGWWQWTVLGHVVYTVLANTPQVAITFTYFWYNHVLTNMLANAEWSSYRVKRKSLRVTTPAEKSDQRSIHYLSLPWRYSIPLLAVSTLLHWLVSQSFFYVYAIPWADNQIFEDQVLSQLGYLWLPMLLAVLLGAVMMILLIGMSFRKYKSLIPVADSRSAAISAACHPPKDEDMENAAYGKLMWTETPGPTWWDSFEDEIKEGKGHCSFTSVQAGTSSPILGRLYS
ncbi:uncharacterized protein N7483_007605 [Penicillium malachiteum]|uniref:uncharacterized protein n=1 Tax=Penicillium malachiteum TaxID=1324776 RepID=UPI002546DC51|nr:uncharacterized protein N7483_007605 [Penicillium malachiteum]KAJ5726248.1 hypothetical protein N7483_007605 [Penicillium malachiteum]